MPSALPAATGVLLVNLGSPERADYRAIRRYLRQFLSDPRVIEAHPLLWSVVLNFFILPLRPLKTKKNYEAIWLKATDESPLAYYTPFSIPDHRTGNALRQPRHRK